MLRDLISTEVDKSELLLKESSIIFAKLNIFKGLTICMINRKPSNL